MSEPYRKPAPADGRLPTKPAGDYYAVVLREKDFSLLKVGVAGGLGGGGSFPIPEMGDLCACCNADSTTTIPFDASTDRLRVDPIAVPVCATCAGHLRKNTNVAQLVGGSLIPIVVGLGIWSAANGLYWLTAIAVLLGIGGVRWIRGERKKRRETASGIVGGDAPDTPGDSSARSAVGSTSLGHHPHLEIMVAIGQCVVRTTNKRLAEHLATQHARELHRAG